MSEKVKVIKVIKEGDIYFATIENNPFYPDGKGGQLGDRGKIDTVDVLNTPETGVVLSKHLNPGEYFYEIDEKRRFDIAQQHTAQHILSAAFERIASLKTVSFKMGEEYSTIDLDEQNIGEEMLNKAEELSNDIISKCIEVEEIFTDKEGAQKYNLRKPLSDKVSGQVRLIKIDDFDISACGGFHVKNTGNINLLKITNTERVKGNLTRVYFLAGLRAIKDYSQKDSILKNISFILTSGLYDLENKVEILLNENKDYKNRIKKLAEKMAYHLSKDLIQKAVVVNNNKVVYHKKEDETADFLHKYVNLKDYTLIIEDEKNKTFSIVSNNINCKELIDKLKMNNNIKGGGSEVRGNISGDIKFKDILKILEK
ncbi:hypothetical protein CN13_06180 [Petrotoga sp. HKA.pet.4.5]|uniref:alanyl-tRNA editing protein n=1 Tax=unclassified Petrotoga TaxID=2620614 RepID=UPI000EF16C47|nr:MULTISPECIES: alanyl-tRNA editing protein [unclassified Petrotoga]RLL82811.1 hypothetical protein BZ25_08970 [Petrotoga sp. Shatin.DS.tank11.9.2.9.3]RLL89392.1 hypothetical protein CN13_06180 [Petrotoga sp. HKA.pet.4.5]